MPIASIRPSTVDGIKQLATKLKRETLISHTTALDLASRQAGFENFVHARRQLAGGKPRYGVYLSGHWYASARRHPDVTRRSGRELLLVELQKPLPEVIAKHRVGYARGLVGFRMEYEDHLEHQTNFDSQESARNGLLEAARSLRFMEATGLQPVTTQPLRHATRELDNLPSKDHMSTWFDPTTNHWVVLDEPYGQAIERQEERRGLWVSEQGLHMLKPVWEGLYYPGECVPHFVGPDAAFLKGLGAVVETLPPMRTPDPWPFESGFNGDDFVSPKRRAAGKARKPRPSRSYRDHNGARPYGGRPGVPSRWRPVQSLPLEQHQALGKLFAAFSLAKFSWRAHLKLQSFRSQLEDWAFTEHGNNAPNDLYYGRMERPALSDRAAVLAALGSAKEIVESGYNDCKPRRELIAALDSARADAEQKMA